MTFGVLLHGVTDIAERRAGPHLLDTLHHRLERDLAQPLGENGRLADEIHATGVAVPAILDHGDIDVDDVAVLEDFSRARDAVADDVVDRRAHSLGKALVADVRRHRFLHIDDVIVGDRIDFFGRGAGLDVRHEQFQHLGGEAAGDAHLLDFSGGLDGDGHPPIVAEQ